MNIAKQTTVAFCPDCDEEIEFTQVRPKLGLKFTCPHCETYLEVVNLNPLTLSWDDGAYEDDDNWDTDDDW